MARPNNQGMTLIEITALIVVLSFLAAYFLLPIEMGLIRTDRAVQNLNAAYLAQERTFLIYSKKQSTANGFASLSDPCPGADICDVPSSLSVSSSIVPTLLSNHFKLITTTVSGDGHNTTQLIVSDHATQ